MIPNFSEVNQYRTSVYLDGTLYGSPALRAAAADDDDDDDGGGGGGDKIGKHRAMKRYNAVQGYEMLKIKLN